MIDGVSAFLRTYLDIQLAKPKIFFIYLSTASIHWVNYKLRGFVAFSEINGEH